MPGATPATTSFANGARPASTSGPIPGYVPYAHVYSTSAHAQNDSHGHDPRDSPRGSSDRYDRKDYRVDPRSRRYESAPYLELEI